MLHWLCSGDVVFGDVRVARNGDVHLIIGVHEMAMCAYIYIYVRVSCVINILYIL